MIINWKNWLIISLFVLLVFNTLGCFNKKSNNDKNEVGNSIAKDINTSEKINQINKENEENEKIKISDSSNQFISESEQSSNNEIVIDPILLAKKELLHFSLYSSLNSDLKKNRHAEIRGKRVTIIIPRNVNKNSLIPTLKISDYASVIPAPGKRVDFSKQNVNFTVIAQNGDKKVYKVSVFNQWEFINFNKKRALSYGAFGYRKDFNDSVVTGQSFKPTVNTVLNGVTFSFFGKFRTDNDIQKSVSIGMDIVDVTYPGQEKILQSTVKRIGQNFSGGDVFIPLRFYQYMYVGREYCMTLYLIDADSNFCLNNLLSNSDDLTQTGIKFSSTLKNGRSEKNWRYYSSDDGWDLWMKLSGGRNG